MRKIYIYALAAALLSLAGCGKEMAPEGAGGITVQASIGTMTKVSYDGASTSFTAGDRIAVYAWTGSAASVPASRVVNGEVNTFDGTAWTPANPMEWDGLTKPHYFLGITPVAAVSDFTADPYTLDPSKYTDSDLLIATSLEGITPSATPVDLTFTHAMAKLNVNLKFRSEFDGTPAVTSVTVKAKKTATVNYLTKAVTATGDASEVDIPATATAATGYALSFSGLQVPQSGVTTVTVTIAGKTYVYESATDIPLESGKYTTLGLVVGKDKIELASVEVADWTTGTDLPGGEAVVNELSIPLTIEAIEAGAEVSFIVGAVAADFVKPIYYRTCIGSVWSDWSVYSAPVTLVSEGDKIQFKGTNATYSFGRGADYNYCTFNWDKDCYLYGNMMSLIDKDAFSTGTPAMEDFAFCSMFKGNTHLKTHALNRLLLPATTLVDCCYYEMFSGCTSLTTAPSLPATTLADDCYVSMFSGCTSLTTAPSLPATTLANNCYGGMFEGCTSLTTVPVDFLPVTTLEPYCYAGMFKGCTSLTAVPADLLPATTLASDCYKSMFRGCTSLTSAPSLPATTLANNCYIAMFEGCTSLTAVPADLLPATTLANNCYTGMFEGCTSLTAVPADLLPATTLADGCYSSMFYGCTSLTSAPSLPATTLAKNCYEFMFSGCTSLTIVPADLLPATTLAYDCYSRMFYGCTNLTTAPRLPAQTLTTSCYYEMFMNCSKLPDVTCLATTFAGYVPLNGWLDGAGTADGCERKVYVDPSMLGIGTGNSDGEWNLADSGTDGKRWTLENADYANLTSADIGKVLGANGKIYADAASANANGGGARAVISYVGGVPNYFDKFLAIAMEDVDGNKHTWADAQTAVGTYAGSHAITIGGTNYNTNAIGSTYYDIVATSLTSTSATRATGVVKGWRQPSVTDWRYVFDGLGRQKAGLTLTAKYGSDTYSSNATPIDPLGVVNNMYYYKDGDADGASSLRSAINTACGNTALQSGGYWSSSERYYYSDSAWYYDFYDGKLWDVNKAYNSFYARAVFAY